MVLQSQEQDLVTKSPTASGSGLRQKRGAVQQESRATASSCPAVLDTEATTSQIPDPRSLLLVPNYACPTQRSELIFSSLDSVICLPLVHETCFLVIIIVVLSSSAFFFSLPRCFKYILYASAQRCRWKAKPCCAHPCSNVW